MDANGTENQAVAPSGTAQSCPRSKEVAMASPTQPQQAAQAPLVPEFALSPVLYLKNLPNRFGDTDVKRLCAVPWHIENAAAATALSMEKGAGDARIDALHTDRVRVNSVLYLREKKHAFVEFGSTAEAKRCLE